ncbi:uncharacterized protein [Fopius arisanus]|uniref:Uncharacterized protein n=1 Tax=Fopius arisanus TaxID=64838 RepID=A0A9R1TCE3_9HYME|nr:PREDICTED: uncharacterized protein LOC105268717 [Fopius arisanus]
MREIQRNRLISKYILDSIDIFIYPFSNDSCLHQSFEALIKIPHIWEALPHENRLPILSYDVMHTINVSGIVINRFRSTRPIIWRCYREITGRVHHQELILISHHREITIR